MDEKAKWTRLASVGLLLAGFGPLLILLAMLIWGLDPEDDLVFFLSTVAIAWFGALLVWQFGAWSKFVGVVAGLLVAMALFWTAFGLAQPASFFDFMPGVLVLPGALLAIVASISALVAKRRGHLTSRPEGGERLGVRIVIGVVVLAAVVSGGLSVFTRSSASAGEAETTVGMKDFKFDQREYEVSAGAKVFIRNDDPFFHTFTVDELGIDEGFSAGGSKVIDIPGKPGTYILYCAPHTGSPEDPAPDDMAATITVT